RSWRIAFVAPLSSSVVYPASVAACVRPCSNETQAGVRNGRIAIAITTTAAAMAVASAARRSGRGRGTGAWESERVANARARTAPRASVLERPGLLPPAGDRQVRRRLHVQLQRGPMDPRPERVEIEAEDVGEAVDPALHQELMIIGPEARQVEHQRLVAPCED